MPIQFINKNAFNIFFSAIMAYK
ncbi:uncharacterized protein METZ01_LOCUS359562 [marine metagenome]|uniref:Uncharacterized protein n=1 Tax=marine metagenome TaxID=408172 RepID=A0A382SC29_9ZZZZ